MNPNGNFQGLSIKPIDLTHKIPVLHNWMNSPKTNQPIKLSKPLIGTHDSKNNYIINAQ